MSSGLQALLEQRICVITTDGRLFVGTLQGFDQSTNIIISKSHERVYSANAGVEKVQLGLQLIRGDNVALAGEVDEDVDARIDLESVMAPPLKPVSVAMSKL